MYARTALRYPSVRNKSPVVTVMAKKHFYPFVKKIFFIFQTMLRVLKKDFRFTEKSLLTINILHIAIGFILPFSNISFCVHTS